MLSLQEIKTFYGASQALFGITMAMQAGEVVTLLGRNGMGKTTTIRSIMGLTPAASGIITLEGREIQRLPSHAIARLGLGLVPEGRQIFPNLTLRENLIATAANYSGTHDPYTIDRILSIFPRLADRINHYGNQLSGGEQQMLAIARALMINPKILILDEATEGLAPMVRDEIWQGLELLKNRGESILVIDKNLDALLKIADRHYILQKGYVVWSGASSDLADNDEVKVQFLGV